MAYKSVISTKTTYSCVQAKNKAHSSHPQTPHRHDRVKAHAAHTPVKTRNSIKSPRARLINLITQLKNAIHKNKLNSSRGNHKTLRCRIRKTNENTTLINQPCRWEKNKTIKGLVVILTTLLLSTAISANPSAKNSTTGSAPDNAKETQVYSINLPSQSVAKSLTDLSEQIDVLLLFPYDLAKQVAANPVNGSHTLPQALQIMLEGTGFSGSLTKKGVLMISLAKSDGANQGTKERKGMNINKRKNLLATFITMFASGAMAQGVDGDQQAATQQSSIDEIVVTAQKKEERLLDVPISISVVDDEFIADAGISNIIDLAYAVPNLSVIESGPGLLRAAIRGVTNSNGSSTLTGIYLDEIPLSITPSVSVNLETIDIERVEVLKGPQGTFYGQGSVGGTIRFITKEPSFDGIEGQIGGSAYGTKDGSSSGEFTGVLNLPVIDDTLAFRVAATYKDKGGWIDRPDAGIEDANDSELSSIRLKGLWNISKDFTADLTAIRHRAEDGGISRVNSIPISDSNLLSVVRNGLDFPSTDIDYQYDLYNLTLNYDLGFATFTSSSSLTDVEVFQASQQNFGPPDLVALNGLIGAEAYSQELRLAGTSNAVDWVIGGFYTDIEENQNLADLGIYIGGNFLFGISDLRFKYTSQSTAIFGNLTYHISDQLTVSLGARSFEDDRSFDDFSVGGPKEDTFDNVSLKGSISYAPTESSNVYFSVSEGFRSGGFNPSSDLTYDPETMISYEIGTKATVLDGRLNVETAIYHSEYQDYQSGLLVLGVGTIIQNPGEAEIRGVEWSTQLKVNEHLSLGFNGNFTDAEFTTVSEEQIVFVGDSLNEIPKYSYSINADFDFNWSSSIGGFAHINVNRQGPSTETDRSTTIPVEQQVLESSDLNLLNAQLGAQWDDFTIRLFGRNLTNELRAINPSHFGIFTQNRPRTMGVSFIYDF